MKTSDRKILIASIATAALLAAMPAMAALVPSECLGAASVGSCGLQSLVNVFVLFANYIFGIAASLAFVFFVYGGFTWLSSAGSSEKIKKGQTIVTNAVIGLVLIFGARGIVSLVIQAVTAGANVPTLGGSCTKPGMTDKTIQSRFFTDTDGKLVCVASCDDLKDATGKPYTCAASTGSSECENHLCGDANTDVCCPKEAGGSGSGSGADVNSGANTKMCDCTFADKPGITLTASISEGVACSAITNCTYDSGSGICDCTGAQFQSTEEGCKGISCTDAQ